MDNKENINSALDKFFNRHSEIVDTSMHQREILINKVMSLVEGIKIDEYTKPSAIEAQLAILSHADTILKSKEHLSNAHIKLLLQNKNTENDAQNLENVASILKMIKIKDTSTNSTGNLPIDDTKLEQLEKDLDIKISEDELKETNKD